MPSETEKYSYLCGSIAKKRTQNEKNPPIYIFTHHCHPGNDCTHRHRHGTCSHSTATRNTMLPCDGTNVTLPHYTALADADLLIVESMQQAAITTLPYRRTRTVSVSSLPRGVYILRTLNSKGVSHRVGMFRK